MELKKFDLAQFLPCVSKYVESKVFPEVGLLIYIIVQSSFKEIYENPP